MSRPIQPNASQMSRPIQPNASQMSRPIQPNASQMSRPIQPNASQISQKEQMTRHKGSVHRYTRSTLITACNKAPDWAGDRENNCHSAAEVTFIDGFHQAQMR
ncbi:hypothetical protein BaRGS_00008700 [Batillaria attramentaria]|uniref:Uncharacterized protein n=1 Tax=Batillaria attramentaria TaxID=370345 RepID=A0ABD0LL33_9CAEN